MFEDLMDCLKIQNNAKSQSVNMIEMLDYETPEFKGCLAMNLTGKHQARD